MLHFLTYSMQRNIHGAVPRPIFLPFTHTAYFQKNVMPNTANNPHTPQDQHPTPCELSFIIPAHNEADFLPKTLTQLNTVIAELNLNAEIIVVNDNSTDTTPQIATDHGATLINVNLRHIAAVRNAGAANSSGQYLFFIDADTFIPAPTVADALTQLNNNYIAGGAKVTFDEHIRFDARFFLGVWNLLSRTFKWAAGCFIFTTREAFQTVGGFDEQFYAAEEIVLSKALRQQGRTIILKSPVHTSARKLKSHTPLDHLKVLLRVVFSRGKALHQRDHLNIWYDDQRNPENADKNDQQGG